MNGSIPRDAEGRALTRQEILLLLVEQHSFEDGRYWYPRRNEALTIGRELFHIFVYGAGDSSALKALVRKGQIEDVYNGQTHMGYRITEDGKLRAQSIV